ncbi:bacillithiol biosynthesis cysteine-adding enzyme BshC [Echinicola marina]|uniref:bacillithiol biosynthesis cysteine-adding enzyme BshC n=1 Tax=Echinicola marina TaxID=2859768 RepID=UPI001CF6F4F7|nr:bacillithiol biosynthesis cysteine-adding enzyme BshC [Echinicola marina]UCS94824.1 bacillithiol biosynthesis cysteine-adding enzyme BshC [Echinicola marina]
MMKSTLEPECTGQFSPLFIDYIRKDEKLRPFYNQYPSLENFESIIQERKFDQVKRTVLKEALEKQYVGFELSEKVQDNIQALKGNKTFTVTTGHQLNLFTGPLYFIYKIVSTINLAEQLQQRYPEYHFVPVYWMATEDHDFEEINHFTYEGKKYSWQTDQKGAVGDFKLDAKLQALLKELNFAPDFFKRAYTEQENLAQAVRYYVNYLFGDKGLVIVDGHDVALKQLFKPVIKDDLQSNQANDLVNEQTGNLENLGYKSQIFPREINFFYLDKGLRSRIVKTKSGFEILDTGEQFQENELLELVEEHPEKFSPNVVLRPLYQEYILPNIAYLGGPAEVAYWLQLKLVFDRYQTDFPMVMPRNFAMILNANAQRRTKTLGLGHAEIFVEYADWKKQYVLEHSRTDLSLEKEKEALKALFEKMGEEAAEIDPTLKPSSEAAKTRAVKVLEHFGKKLRKAEERNLETALRQMQDLKELLFPGGTPQERKNNFLEFYLADNDFIASLYHHFDPLDFNFIILEQDGRKS